MPVIAMTKTYNFSAGPSALFPAVVDQIKNDLGNWNGTQSSVMEVSHRGADFMQLYHDMVAEFTKLMQVPDTHQVLLMHGGARGTFAGIPLNHPRKFNKALYLTSGHWSRTAAKEAQKFIEVVSAELTDKQGRITKLDWTAETKDVDYLHYCMNETVDGVEIFDELVVAPGCELVVDMSSNILSRPVDVSKFGVIYAGAQKNIGASGVTFVIVKKSLLNQAQPNTADILNWTIASTNDSMINTPCTFAWYTCELTFKHLLKEFGSTEALAAYNKEKADLVYNYIDESNFYLNEILPGQRSRMNVVFKCPTPELDALFVSESNAAGLKALKGHKVVGGLRASIYNANGLDAAQALVDFMKSFAAKYATK